MNLPGADMCDVFPGLIATYDKIDIPKFLHVANFLANTKMSAFLPYIRRTKPKLHYKMSGTNIDAIRFTRHLAESKTDLGRLPFLDWAGIVERLSVSRKDRGIDDDLRLSYRWNNTFLVNSMFTFGQRTVDKDTVHIIRTDAAPMIYFRLLPGTRALRLTRCLEQKEFWCYRQFTLDPYTDYVINSNTCYILMTSQKTLFAINHIPKSAVSDLDIELTTPEKPLDPYATLPTPILHTKSENLVDQEEHQAKRIRLEYDFQSICWENINQAGTSPAIINSPLVSITSNNFTNISPAMESPSVPETSNMIINSQPENGTPNRRA